MPTVEDLVARRSRNLLAQLNLMPVMNLITILIPLLLISVQFASLSVIDTTLPGIIDPRDDPPPPPDLNLSLVITGEGITVAGADAILDAILDEGEGPTVPCSTGECRGVESYDLARLNDVLVHVKDEFPDHDRVMLVPDSRIPYEVLIGVMDAARAEEGTQRELFPAVVMAGGA